MGARFVVTPWRDAEELLQLRTDLYGGGAGNGLHDRRAQAVNKILAWRSRKQDVPLLLESTADVVDVLLQDEQGGLPHNALRLLYATAISRFMTGLSDTQTDLARDRPSWKAPGKTLQLPITLFEIRHCIVHRHLPSLSELKRAARESLDWLWEWYWSQLEAAFSLTKSQNEDSLSKSDGKTNLQTMLRSYVKERKSEIKTKKNPTKAADWSCSSYKLVLLAPETKRNVLLDLLVDETAILPADKKLGSSMSGAFLIWDPLLLALSTSSPSTFQALLDRLTTNLFEKTETGKATGFETDPTSEGVYEWILHLLISNEWEEVRRRSQAKTLGPDGETQELKLWEDVLGRCFTYANAWSLKLAEALIKGKHVLDAKPWVAILEAARGEDGTMEEVDEPSSHMAHEDSRTEIEEDAWTGSAAEMREIQVQDKIRGPQKKIGMWRPTPIGALPDGWDVDE